MWVIVGEEKSTEIDDYVVNNVLSLYPEEELEKRTIFKNALANGIITFSDLFSESGKILIPWQMFFLSDENFRRQIDHIEKQRAHKVSAKLVAKRRGTGDVTSKRIIDRLIRLQNFLISTNSFSKNPFCGMLNGLSTKEAVVNIMSFFELNREVMWRDVNKGLILEYLIKQVEFHNINISRGVLSNKILPTFQVVPSDIYRSTSGFVIKDERIPFVFLPSEINPDEVESRQIYTLIYLIVVIGLEQYDYYLEKDFNATIIGARGMQAKIHKITAELLMPTSETDKLRGVLITSAMRDNLARKFKVSPSALITTLRMRGVVTHAQYEKLKPPPFVSRTTGNHPWNPKVSTSVEKFCGTKTFRTINSAIQNGTLLSIQAQYLIFGAVNKKGYYKYRNELKI